MKFKFLKYLFVLCIVFSNIGNTFAQSDSADIAFEDIIDEIQFFDTTNQKIKEIVECHLVAGGYDYLLKTRFSDMENYRSILEKVAGLPAISQTHTYMVTEHVKEDSGVPFN